MNFSTQLLTTLFLLSSPIWAQNDSISPSLRRRNLASLGQVDLGKDHIEVHWDMLFDIDDAQCIGAVRMLLDYYNIDATIVSGTHTTKKKHGWAHYGMEEKALNMAFGGPCNGDVMGDCRGTSEQVGWVNAHKYWDNDSSSKLVGEIGTVWANTLKKGGEVWIMEGGMGDFTLDVARWVKQKNPGLNMKKIHSVQHSQWNIDNSGPGVYSNLQKLISHHRIANGNGGYASYSGGDKKAFANKAAKGIYADLWAQIWKGDGGWKHKVDFSDTSELLWIIEKLDMVKNYNKNKKPWENFMDIFNVLVEDGPVQTPVQAPQPAPTTSPVKAPQAPPVAPPVKAPVSPTTCNKSDFLDECGTTKACKLIYGADATDCKNSAGGVCYCGSDVCGCEDGGETCNDGIKNQGEEGIDCGGPCDACACVPQCSGKQCGSDGCGGSCGGCGPDASCRSYQCVANDTECTKADHKNECTTTNKCKSLYPDADVYDCWNGGGGVCLCGDAEVCGCVA